MDEMQISMFGSENQANEKENSARMRELIKILNEASKAYYQDANEIMTNFEYDSLYDELSRLEKETGVVMSQSPTVNVGYKVLSELPKEKHPKKMLSLDKTKDVEALKSFLGDKAGVLSWKLDGLTVVLTYRGGKLEKAVTRGNGEIGEVITENAKVFTNVPIGINFKGELILRGEAVITYPDFEKINEKIDDDSKYKNPRNLCSGSVRQLDPGVTKERHVKFFAFSLVSAEGKDFDLRMDEFRFLEELGFDVVERKLVTSDKLSDAVKWFSAKINDNEVPSDGLVLLLNDIKYGKSLGTTAKFPKDAIAFKWQDEIARTKLLKIEWSSSRTGLINPIAVFEPVELEGTTVSRASVHNISVMRELKLGLGDEIAVYKANMIIPQIAENFTKTNNVKVPSVCPSCGGDTVIRGLNGVETLNCPNPDCPAKQIKGFTHFVTRDAMDIEGLSEMTIEKLVDMGFIKEFSDIFHIDRFRNEIIEMEGFGEKSFENLKASVDKARKCEASKLLYALGIPNFGNANAKLVAKYAKNNWKKIETLTKDELLTIDGIGEIMADEYVKFFGNEEKKRIVRDLLSEVSVNEDFVEAGDKLSGKTFVITGSLNHFENREELKLEIEKNGGKVSGSVSAKTSYLINNDLSSTSGKNQKAHELGIPIIDEDTVIEWLK